MYTRYAAKIYALCTLYLGDAEEAKDLTHDLVLKVFDSIKTYHYRGEGSLWGWIKRITINAAINKVSRGCIFEDITSPETEFDLKDPSYGDIDSIPANELLEMVSSLPATQRLILNMFCLDNCSHKEIADRLGITEKASASLLSKARKTLKKKMKDYLQNLK